ERRARPSRSGPARGIGFAAQTGRFFRDEVRQTMRLKSPSFDLGRAIPRRHSMDGENRSPALVWTEVPERTHEFALIMDDPDAPGDEPFVHWIAYGIPASASELPEGLPKAKEVASPVHVKQGANSFGRVPGVGYGGPSPPKGHGLHHYHFHLYALDDALDLT